MRIRAICKCLYHGLMPYWVYEKECHYKPMSYWAHLVINLKYAWVWLTFSEKQEDIDFENSNNIK